jgi:hypothetical protein
MGFTSHFWYPLPRTSFAPSAALKAVEARGQEGNGPILRQ